MCGNSVCFYVIRIDGPLRLECLINFVASRMKYNSIDDGSRSSLSRLCSRMMVILFKSNSSVLYPK